MDITGIVAAKLLEDWNMGVIAVNWPRSDWPRSEGIVHVKLLESTAINMRLDYDSLAGTVPCGKTVDFDFSLIHVP